MGWLGRMGWGLRCSGETCLILGGCGGERAWDEVVEWSCGVLSSPPLPKSRGQVWPRHSTTLRLQDGIRFQGIGVFFIIDPQVFKYSTSASTENNNNYYYGVSFCPPDYLRCCFCNESMETLDEAHHLSLWIIISVLHRLTLVSQRSSVFNTCYSLRKYQIVDVFIDRIEVSRTYRADYSSCWVGTARWIFTGPVLYIDLALYHSHSGPP